MYYPEPCARSKSSFALAVLAELERFPLKRYLLVLNGVFVAAAINRFWRGMSCFIRCHAGK